MEQHPLGEMRRRDRAVAEEEARAFLAKADYGILATVGADGWPYAVPVHHVLLGDRLYIHCAQAGHKLDNLAAEARVSYCVVTQAQVLPRELTSHFESAVVFGRAERVTELGEKQLALEAIGRRFSAAFPAEVATAIQKHGGRTEVLRIQIERLTGKANRM